MNRKLVLSHFGYALALITSVGIAHPGFTIAELPKLANNDDALAHGVNKSGDVIGVSRSGIYQTPILWRAGVTIPLFGEPPGFSGGAYAINHHGTVVGGLGAPSRRAWSWHDGDVTYLSDPSHEAASALRINDRGDVLGHATFDGETAPAVWSGGLVRRVPGLPAHTDASWINNLGDVVTTTTPLFDPSTSAIVAEDGTVTQVSVPDWTRIRAFTIDDERTIVGWGRPQSGNDLGFVQPLDGSSLRILQPPPGDDVARALRMNAEGVIFGRSEKNAPHAGRAVIWEPGSDVAIDVETLFADPGNRWSDLYAQGMNDAGQIVGYGVLDGAGNAAFILTPVPEPAALGAAALLSLVRLARRRR